MAAKDTLKGESEYPCPFPIHFLRARPLGNDNLRKSVHW